MFQNSPLQVNFTSFSATDPEEGRSCVSPSLSRLAKGTGAYVLTPPFLAVISVLLLSSIVY